MSRKIGVLRLDHRTLRDQRITTHVALTARALGCTSFTYTGEKDVNMVQSLEDVSHRWGGDMEIVHIDSPKSFIQKWDGIKIHLTMYGENHTETINVVKEFPDQDLLIIVGGGKVPRYIYSLVDFNTAVGWQPHSEVAAVGLFLLGIVGVEALYSKFSNANISILPNNQKSQRSERFRNS